MPEEDSKLSSKPLFLLYLYKLLRAMAPKVAPSSFCCSAFPVVWRSRIFRNLASLTTA